VPDGDAVYVTGTSQGTSLGEDYATIAYSTTTGARLWLRRFSGPLNLDFAAGLTVSPSTGSVFVTGYSGGSTSVEDYATISYNGATGKQLWATRYNGPGNGNNQATALAISPGANTLFVTGDSAGGHDLDYATIAYNTTTGKQLWARRYNGPGNGNDIPFAVAVSPDGNTVYITGSSKAAATGGDYATVAYNTTTGTQLWTDRYNGLGNGNDTAYSVAASPATGTIFVTGASLGSGVSQSNFATIAYHG
jgi:glucose dehydrogenase